MNDQIAVQYVGPRAHYVEGAYGSGVRWVQGQTQLLPTELAAKLLRHPDVYVPGKAPGATVAQVTDTLATESKEEQDTQDMRDQVAAMDKKALAMYAETHFNLKLDHRKSVDVLRQQITGLVDQFGVV